MTNQKKAFKRGPKLKQGLDYFPMATRSDSRYKVIRALHGDTGYVILNTLLQDIHGDKGYFTKWNDRLAMIFAHENNFQYETTIAIIKDCFIEQIFNEELFHKYQILTSEEIQQVWINVAKERKEIFFNQEYLLIDILPYLKNKNRLDGNESKTSESIGQVLPEEFFSNDRDDDPDINSNNPGFNFNNPAVKKQAKEAKEAKQANQTNQANQLNQRSKESEALGFSRSAEFFFHLKKSKKIILKKNAKKPSSIPKNLEETAEIIKGFPPIFSIKGNLDLKAPP